MLTENWMKNLSRQHSYKMRYPVLEIDLNKLRHNTKVELDFFHAHGIEVMGVNKVFNGMPETAEAIVQGGMKVVAESNMGNLIKLKNLPCEKALLRSPGLSEIPDAIRYADISLVAEIGTVEALSKEAARQGRTHKILLMVDMGDLREGIWFEEKAEIEAAVKRSWSFRVWNFMVWAQISAVSGPCLRQKKTRRSLPPSQKKSRKNYPFTLNTCRAATVPATAWWKTEPCRGDQPPQIGAQHEFGIEYVEGRYLKGYCHSNKDIGKYASDAYILKGEIVEVRKKPTVPVGELGMDAFMNTKTFVDRGVRKQAILSFGRQEVPWENIHPVDERILVLGQTSNHTVVDVSDAGGDYRLGDIVSFEIDYTALLHLCCTADVEKRFIGKEPC